METLDELYARHEKEMQDLMVKQIVSWNALNDRYGKGNIPSDTYQQWNEQFGNTPLHGLRARQSAELESYPFKPLDMIYENVPYEQPTPEPDIFDQLKDKQAAQHIQEVTEKTLSDTPAKPEDDIFTQLRRQQEQQERDGKSIDPER